MAYIGTSRESQFRIVLIRFLCVSDFRFPNLWALAMLLVKFHMLD